MKVQEFIKYIFAVFKTPVPQLPAIRAACQHTQPTQRGGFARFRQDAVLEQNFERRVGSKAPDSRPTAVIGAQKDDMSD